MQIADNVFSALDVERLLIPAGTYPQGESVIAAVSCWMVLLHAVHQLPHHDYGEWNEF